jgi:tetratricopeptide (TPR) repeat protein
MKQLKFTLLASFITILCSSALYGAEITKGHVPPPDSSSSIMDRTAALYLIEEGKEFFNQGMVKDAMRKFREAYVRDKFSYKAAYWIGETHYEMDNYGYALKYAKIAERLSEAAEGEVFLLLGKAYHRQSYLDSASMNYDLAKIQLSSRKQNVFNIQQLIDEVKFAKNAKKDTSNFERKLLGDYVNSGHNDYAVTLFNDGKELFFVSRRPGTTGGNINPSDQQYFEDIYYSNIGLLIISDKYIEDLVTHISGIAMEDQQKINMILHLHNEQIVYIDCGMDDFEVEMINTMKIRNLI